ncbi:hypothetical protein K474DRAFT_1655194 [Panus rudis PR-1116 ss-1]|nr:hypothetical protein K474DRAFT_1655194 [Panus rudis PR-1116 ss-1]
MPLFEIEWDSHADAHSRRRIPYRHKASTIHGWVTKLRGTLLDNEAVRKQGIQEMRDAKRIRKERKMHARGSSNGFLSFFTISPRQAHKVSRRPHNSSKAVILRRDSGGSSQRHRDHKGKPLLPCPPSMSHSAT